MKGIVLAVCKSETHTMQKWQEKSINLLDGLGVEGDAHLGVTVKHRSRVAKDPSQPNLRQVHLIHTELFTELKEKGFDILAGQMGENITTSGINLLELPKHTKLLIGESAIVEITGLRNPCEQLNGITNGLLQAVLDYDQQNNLIRKAGVMGIVLKGGIVEIGNEISVELPKKPHEKLERV